MAVPQRREERHAPASKPHVHLVVDRTAEHKRYSAVVKQEHLVRRIFALVLCFVATIVLVGLGPVWLSAEATRHSQQSILIKKDITSQISVAQRLELKRSALTSASRVNKIATEQLGMVPIGTRVGYIDIGAEPAPVSVAQAGSTRTAKNSALLTVARLTAGEASALLVGDVGLASSR